MRWMIVNTDYGPQIDAFYRDRPWLVGAPYRQQHAQRMATFAGTADCFSHHLRQLGHEAWDVIANMEPMQRRWADEYRVAAPPSTTIGFRMRRGIVPWIERRVSNQWLYDVLAAQVRRYQPDVLYCMALETVDTAFLQSVRPHYGIAIGQHAAPMPTCDVSGYDLILSSLPNQVDAFAQMGVAAKYMPLAFEPRVLDVIDRRPKRHDVVFVGGLGKPHRAGRVLLEKLCERFDVKVWGYGIDQVPPQSPIHRCHRGVVWGRDMYQTLADAKVVFNRHIDIAGDFANNMRLFEATGVGALLVTDEKRNLGDLFEPGREVVTYRDHAACIAQIARCLDDDRQRRQIAEAGQQRALRDHSYTRRVGQIAAVAGRQLQRASTNDRLAA